MSTRDDLKEKWARLKAQGQTTISITIGTTDKRTILKVQDALADTMLNGFDASLTWDKIGRASCRERV